MQLDAWLKSNIDDVVSHRRWLHQHPEVGFKEFETSGYCIENVKSYGYSPVQSNLMQTGFYADIGPPNGKSIALRCDMDALPIDEKNSCAYKSLKSGFSHACGHDVHMAIQLGVMKYFSELDKVNGLVRFIFQPAEEMAPGGALSMIDSGVIDDIDMILGGHVQPKLETGLVGLKAGAIAAHVDIIEINLSGPGGHTSRPENSVDLILSTSRLVDMLNAEVNNKLSNQTPVVISFGSVDGGFTFNVIPSSVTLKGTLRYLDTDKRDEIMSVINKTISQISVDSSAAIDFQIIDSSPVLYNSDELHQVVRSSAINALGKEMVVDLHNSSMGGEDFAYYLERIEGYYMRIGCYDGSTTDIHTDTFDVDERCIASAIRVYVSAILSYLG